MYDELLEWCSERLTGSMTAFREAHDWLAEVRSGDRPAWSLTAYKLQILGHLEVSWTGQGTWAVTPSVITMLDNSGGIGMLVGARPRWLMRRLRALESDPDPELAELSLRVMVLDPQPQPQGDGPPTLYLTARDDGDLWSLSDAMGIKFEGRVASRLQEALPVLDSYLHVGWKAATPPGFQPRRFNLRARERWTDVEDETTPGAYEYTRYGPPRYFFYDGDTWAEADKWIVVYAELRRLGEQVLYYRTKDQTLLVSSRTPLPLLYARAAVLRTGMLPTFSSGPFLGVPPFLGSMLEYPNVTPKLFTAIADRLGQDPETTKD